MDGKLESFDPCPDDFALLETVREACATKLPQAFERLSFSTGIEDWIKAVYACNQYVDEQAPWALRKTDFERMKVVLQTLFMALRDLAIAIQPVVPEKAAAVLDQLGIPDGERNYTDLADTEWYMRLVESGFTVAKPTPIFPRLELPEEESAA
jgi:methionyl-tRNA synthetase